MELPAMNLIGRLLRFSSAQAEYLSSMARSTGYFPSPSNLDNTAARSYTTFRGIAWRKSRSWSRRRNRIKIRIRIKSKSKNRRKGHIRSRIRAGAVEGVGLGAGAGAGAGAG